ncbi:MAG: rhamnulokinase [Paraprevotella sp.]|nr:rhamnulokinase [Paraprevotella sp.]
MTNTSAFLAVDLGATSGRTVLATFDGEKLNLREWTRFKNPMIPMSGHLYWDLPALYNEILQALRKVAEADVKLTSIGIDTWGVDFAFFTSDGRLSSLPYCYRDPHTEGAIERFFERMSATEVYERTGIQFMEFNSLFQLDTLQRDGCVALQEADKILFIPDALSYLLTGKAVAESTIVSTSQLMDPRSGELDEALLEAVGLTHEHFAPMVRPGTVVGCLTPQVQAYTGLGDVPVVAVAGHDTASAVISVPAEDENFAYLSCGTWSLLGIETPQPIITSESFRQNFTNEGGLDGTTRFLKNICGLWLFERCREEFTDAPADVAELAALCEQSDYDGLINPDAPCFAHPESMTQAIVEYCNRTGQESPQQPADFCRCIFRSLSLRYRQVIEILRTMSPIDIKKLHVIGGGSLNRYLMQYAADATGLTVISGPSEGTALGNALVQLRTAGGVSTLGEMRKVSAASVTPIIYEPHHTEAWEQAYEQFLLIQKKETNN